MLMRNSKMTTILLTGATGYIGRRLKQKLLEDPDVHLRLLVRHPEALSSATRDKVELVGGSTFDRAALDTAMQDVDTAYYLIHSLGSGDFAEKDRISAANFRDAAIDAGIKRIIYLCGLGSTAEQTSADMVMSSKAGKRAPE